MIEDISKADFADIKRVIAMHATSNDANAIAGIALEDMHYDVGEVLVFAPAAMECPCSKDNSICSNRWIAFPEDADTPPKQKNFIIKWLEERNFKGFLHMVESSVKFNIRSKDYIEKLESTMDVLDYDIHFSTATDRCNYVFNKFCPRLELVVDDEQYHQMHLPSKICFTSHSNVSYVTINFSKLEDGVPKFDERFSIGMFFIIEYLARRKATRRDDQLYYMNQYLSIGDEVGGYDIINESQYENDEQAMQTENALFKSLAIDYAPDNNIDVVLGTFYNKVKSKL